MPWSLCWSGKLASRLVEQGAVIECEPLPPAVLDKPRLNDLFEVLVDNALIHARPLDHTQSLRIRISGERGEGLSRYRVADNGRGIRTNTASGCSRYSSG